MIQIKLTFAKKFIRNNKCSNLLEILFLNVDPFKKNIYIK